MVAKAPRNAVGSVILCTALHAIGCANGSKPDETPPAGGAGGESAKGSGGTGASGEVAASSGAGVPSSCDEAAQQNAYVGCDFWPTAVANLVWSIFDYAVVVANAGSVATDVTVERDGNVVATATVPPDGLSTIYLPWIPELKGPDFDSCGYTTAGQQAVRAPTGGYHLTTTSPVSVYQFNALEFAPSGGPPDKDWSSCPAYSCAMNAIDCYSYSNDASLLLPTSAMTGTYRVFGHPGWKLLGIPGYIAITGTHDGTSVSVYVSPTGSLEAGADIPAVAAGGVATFSLDAGEVVQLPCKPGDDLSGTLVHADHPVQVIFGFSCTNIPNSVQACDHIEESLFPAETLGKRYVVAVPTNPEGVAGMHVVRLYGNVDGTTLTYSGAVPAGTPQSLSAGEVVNLGIVSGDFEVQGSAAFGLATFQVGGALVDPQGQRGDPAMSLATAVEQHRTKYVFLAPADYERSFVDIVQPLDAAVELDGVAVTSQPTPISADYGVSRVELSAAGGGAHVLLATKPVGIQVLGYGFYTSYQYPGGSDLTPIAPPPDIPK